MRNTRTHHIAYTALALAVLTALACGPDWTQLLADRSGTLQQGIGLHFSEEAQHLVPRPKVNFPIEVPQQDSVSPKARVATNAGEGLNAEQARLALTARKAKDGDEAYRLGKTLPESVRLYIAGAVQYDRGVADGECGGDEANCPDSKKQEADWLKARDDFAKVLSLPAKERAPRATWAAYMLGRTEAKLGHADAAMVAFERTRQLANAGAPDPEMLAESSYGEAARVQLDAKHYAEAVTLYAQQAALGSESGRLSLSIVAQQLTSLDSKTMQQAVTNPTLARLMALYALDDLYGVVTVPDKAPSANAGNDDTAKQSDEPWIVKFADALDVNNPGLKPFADYLAAAAYNAGRFQLAAKLALLHDTPRAQWVLAKLAARNGHYKEAAAHYAAAAKAFPTIDRFPAGTPPMTTHVQAERGVLSLARGEYTTALAQLYSVSDHYWLDAAYVAERVVSIDELKAFVDAHVPEPPLPELEHAGDQVFAKSDPDAVYPASNPAAQLRDLLARRLMRAGRYDEALPYFHANGDKRFGDDDARDHARQYAKALRAADRAWTRVGRAKSLYEAAVLARDHGIDILGYEGGPDSAAVGGNLDLGFGVAKDKLTTADEVKRFKATEPANSTRFHYRDIAAKLAAQAADAIPANTQAAAAMLCHATNWTQRTNPDAAQRYYHAYLKQGPHQAWAADFGHNCPDPSFSRAAMTVARLHWHDDKHWVKHHRAATGLMGVAGFTLLALPLWQWRRRRQAQRGEAALVLPSESAPVSEPATVEAVTPSSTS